jgi:hypothetical protein
MTALGKADGRRGDAGRQLPARSRHKKARTWRARHQEFRLGLATAKSKACEAEAHQGESGWGWYVRTHS